VGLYQIVSFCGLNDSMIELDELIGIDGPIILVEVSNPEFLWPDNLLEGWSQSMETVPP
jgi:hypothetical protein